MAAAGSFVVGRFLCFGGGLGGMCVKLRYICIDAILKSVRQLVCLCKSEERVIVYCHLLERESSFLGILVLLS